MLLYNSHDAKRDFNKNKYKEKTGNVLVSDNGTRLAPTGSSRRALPTRWCDDKDNGLKHIQIKPVNNGRYRAMPTAGTWEEVSAAGSQSRYQARPSVSQSAAPSDSLLLFFSSSFFNQTGGPRQPYQANLLG